MTSDEIIAAVLHGDADDNVDGIYSALRDRQNTIARALLYTLKPGDKVRFNAKAKPAYLNGLTATVVRQLKTKVSITIDDPTLAGRYGHGAISAPPEILEKI